MRWSRFDNATGSATPITSWESVTGTSCEMPDVASDAEFVMAEIAAIDPLHPSWATPVRSYFRRQAGNRWALVGFERLPREQ
jgi:hypothetical protein